MQPSYSHVTAARPTGTKPESPYRPGGCSVVEPPPQQLTAVAQAPTATEGEIAQRGGCEVLFMDGLLELMLDGRTGEMHVADHAFRLLHSLASQQHSRVVQHIVDVGFIPRLQSLAMKFWSVDGTACVGGGLETREERDVGARAAVALLWLAVGGGSLYSQRLLALQLALGEAGRSMQELLHAG